MDIHFEWRSNLGQDEKVSIESKIEDERLLFTPCHDGPLLVALTCSNPLNEFLVGTVKCSCGTLIGRIVGEGDGSEIYLSQYGA